MSLSSAGRPGYVVLGLTLTLSWALAACSGERDTPPPAAAPAPAAPAAPAPAPAAAAPAKEGVLATGAGEYRFTPQTCIVAKEGAEYDIEIEGPGKTPDGEPFWLTFGSTGNELDVSLGVDKPFASSTRTLKAGQHISSPFTIEVTGKQVRATGIELRRIEDQRDTVAVPGPSSLQVDCGG